LPKIVSFASQCPENLPSKFNVALQFAKIGICGLMTGVRNLTMNSLNYLFTYYIGFSWCHAECEMTTPNSENGATSSRINFSGCIDM